MKITNKLITGCAAGLMLAGFAVATPAVAAPTAPTSVSVVTPQLQATAGSYVTGGMRCHWVINWFGLFNGTANKQWVLRCYYGE